MQTLGPSISDGKPPSWCDSVKDFKFDSSYREVFLVDLKNFYYELKNINEKNNSVLNISSMTRQEYEYVLFIYFNGLYGD